MRPLKPISIEYYSDNVRDLIDAFPLGIKNDYLNLVELIVDHGANLRMPYSKAIGNGLFELRLQSVEGIGRVFYCRLPGARIVILHAFIKKTLKTPHKELVIAMRRMRKVNYGKRF